MRNRILAVLLAFAAIAFAPEAAAQLKRTTVIFGYARYTGAGAVVKLTATPGSGIAFPTQGPGGDAIQPTYCVIIIEGGTARWTDGVAPNAVTPTSSVGMPLTGELDYDGSMKDFQIFLPNGVTMNVSYYQ